MSNTLPRSWTITTLAELLVELESGSRPRGGVKAIKTGIPSVGGEHLTYDGTFDFDSVKFVPKAFANSMRKGQIRTNDILVVKDGATTGKTVFVGSDFPFDFAVVNEHVFICRPSSLIEPRFLFRFLMSKEGQQRILENFKGSAQGGINQSFAPNTQIPLAPANEQRRIVAKLEDLLSRVEASQKRLERIPQILKRFRQSVLAAACSGRLTADWRDANRQVESGSELVSKIRVAIIARYKRECELAKKRRLRKPKAPSVMLGLEPNISQLPELAETWTWSYLQNLGEFTRGRSKHRPRNDPRLFGGKYPFIQTGDIARSGGRIASHTQTYNERGLAQSRLFPAGTLCITIAANIAETAVLTYPACFPDSVVGFIPDEGLFEVLWAMYFVRTAQADLETFAPATAQKNINMEILFKLAVPVPPLAEQHEIVRRVEALLALADQIEARYNKAKAHVNKLTQSILAKAFRGELVAQDPNDEPASVLLERIRAERKQQDEMRRAQKGASKMRKGKSQQIPAVRRSLTETLLQAKTKLTPEELFSQAGFDDDSVERFFAELRDGVSHGKIREFRPDKRRVLLEAIPQ